MPTDAGLICRGACENIGQPWSTKCNLVNCMGCDECKSLTPAPVAAPTSAPVAMPTDAGLICRGGCENNGKPWSTKCNWVSCAGCEACESLR